MFLFKKVNFFLSFKTLTFYSIDELRGFLRIRGLRRRRVQTARIDIVRAVEVTTRSYLMH